MTGAATLGGELALAIINGFVPDNGDSIEIMRFTSRSGTFDIVTGTDMGTGIFLSPVYTDTSVVIVASGVRTHVVAPEDPAATADPAMSLPTEIRFAGHAAGAGRATFELALPEPAEIELSVYDARGRRVAMLRDGAEGAGSHSYELAAGRDGASFLPSGVYFARIEIRTGARSETRFARTVLVR